jgi:hypothetical protein
MALVEIQTPIMPPHQGSETGFQKGHPRYGGRRKGSRNKFGGDLREAIVAGIAATGFIERDDKGNPVPTGKRGCQGFVEWLALHEPKTAAALFARVLPYFINLAGEGSWCPCRAGCRVDWAGGKQSQTLARRVGRPHSAFGGLWAAAEPATLH